MTLILDHDSNSQLVKMHQQSIDSSLFQGCQSDMAVQKLERNNFVEPSLSTSICPFTPAAVPLQNFSAISHLAKYPEQCAAMDKDMHPLSYE